jgi:hypothetical protein
MVTFARKSFYNPNRFGRNTNYDLKQNKMEQNKVAFGRISDKAYKKITSLDDLIDKLRYKTSSRTDETLVLAGMQDAERFKARLEVFKKEINNSFPELTYEDVLKFTKYFYFLCELLEWTNAEEMLTCIEYELRKAQEDK